MKKAIVLGMGIIIALGAIFLACVCYFLFTPSGIEIDKSKYLITGIDVSEHTGMIDFRLIKDQKIDFVFIKATEGLDYVDKLFETNFENASKNKLEIGAYHFFRFDKDGEDQANHFLRHMNGKNIGLPLVVDVEEWGNWTSKSPEEVRDEIFKFINTINHYGMNSVLIYTNESTFNKYIKGHFDENDIWICSFSDPPNIEVKWLFWQHSHKGKMKGAEGWVDINTFNGSRQEWESYVRR